MGNREWGVGRKTSEKRFTQRREGTKNAKLLLVILSLYFQDSYFEDTMSCLMKIYRTETLRTLRSLRLGEIKFK